jgi:hypothetical protein
MLSQSSNSPLRKQYDAGNNENEEDPSNTQNYGASQFPPQRIQPPSNTFEEPLNISSLTAGEHKIYEYLQAHGWGENNCSIYIRNARAMQEVLAQHFRSQGWSEGHLKAFNEACDSDLPEQFSAPPATDYEWQLDLLEEMNRRKRIGENMETSNPEPATHDQRNTFS